MWINRNRGLLCGHAVPSHWGFRARDGTTRSAISSRTRYQWITSSVFYQTAMPGRIPAGVSRRVNYYRITTSLGNPKKIDQGERILGYTIRALEEGGTLMPPEKTGITSFVDGDMDSKSSGLFHS